MSTSGPTKPVLTAKAFLFPSCNIIKNKFRNRIDVLYVRALLVWGRDGGFVQLFLLIINIEGVGEKGEKKKRKSKKKDIELTKYGCFCSPVKNKSLGTDRKNKCKSNLLNSSPLKKMPTR